MDAAAAESERKSRQHSSLRIAANRRNALKSTRPRAAVGKRRVALNARPRLAFRGSRASTAGTRRGLERIPPAASAERGRVTKTKPNKAKRVNAIIIRAMNNEFRKQSQTTYHHYFQSVKSILGPFFRKIECCRSMNSEIDETKPNKAKRG
jgi:hypothetical protein